MAIYYSPQLYLFQCNQSLYVQIWMLLFLQLMVFCISSVYYIKVFLSRERKTMDLMFFTII